MSGATQARRTLNGHTYTDASVDVKLGPTTFRIPANPLGTQIAPWPVAAADGGGELGFAAGGRAASAGDRDARARESCVEGGMNSLRVRRCPSEGAFTGLGGRLRGAGIGNDPRR